MENKENKRQLKDLLKDKTFLYSIPVFLILVGSFIYYMAPREGPDGTGGQAGAGLNTYVPTAHNDSLSANKLDLQSETINNEEKQDLSLQSIPGSPDRYVYGSRYRPTATAMNRLDSIYQTGGHRPQPSGIPDRLSPSRPTPVPSMLKEDNFSLEDDGNGSTAEQARAKAAQRAELNKLMEKQRRLESLLSEYKKDKQEAASRAADKTKIYKVLNENGKPPVPVTSLAGSNAGTRNSFYGLYTEDARKAQQRLLDNEVGTIRATIYGDQYIDPTRSRIELRLLEPLYVRGIIIPSNTILYGMGSFQGQRVGITINSIQYQNHLFPVNIHVYDMDGMQGLYVPNMPTADALRNSAGQAMGMGMGGSGFGGGVYLNGSAQAVAASAALQAGQQVYNGIKQSVSRKVQTPRAHLKNNYYVLLKQADAPTAPAQAIDRSTAAPMGDAVSEKMQQIQQLQQMLQETKNQR